MKRLKDTAPNSPQYTDDQFQEVWTGEVGGVDEDRFKKMMAKYKDGPILDVGCFDSPIPVRYEQAIGVDYAPKTIEILSEKYPEASYLCADLMSLPFRGEAFSYILAGEVIEHMDDPEAFVEEMMRMLEFGGILVITTPHNEACSNPVSDQHKWSFDIADIHNLLAKYGKPEVTTIQDGGVKTILAYGVKSR